MHPVLPLPTSQPTQEEAKFKYIDDMSLCHAVNLNDLQLIDGPVVKPLNFRDRTLHHLPSNKNELQKAVNNVHKFSKIQNFKINNDKTLTVIFNTAESKDFYPRITNMEGVLYKNEENFKILGINLASDKKKGVNFNFYIDKCIQKAYSKLWILRRLVEMGTLMEKLIITYNLRVKIYLEQNAPLWMFTISNAMKAKIEKVQKISLFIILGKHAHTDYLCNLAMLDMEPLEERRQRIALNFATKILKHPQHRNIFTYKVSTKTRSGNKVIVPKV